MRKLYLLAALVTVFFLKSFAQAPDTANFIFTIGPNNVVSFVNLSAINGTELRKAHWFFGDGTKQITAPLANTTHQYPVTATVYTACLKIYKYWNNNDSAVTADICKVISFQNSTGDSCKANFTDTTTTTGPLIKTFVGQPWHINNKKPEQICWNFGDGSPLTCINYNPAVANNYNVSHTYAQAGNYNVCVKIKYQGGCIAEYCRTVQVGGDTCKSDFNFEPIANTPKGRKFAALPWHIQQKKPLKICWQFNDGTPDTCIFYTTASTGPYTVNHTFANYGTYNVCAKITYEGGCEAMKCKPVTVNAPTNLDSCAVTVLQVAANPNQLYHQFYATTSPNLTPQKICWYFGDGTDTCIIATSSSPVPLTMSHHYPAPGNYNLCVKVWYTNGCVAMKCKPVNLLSNTNLCGGYMTDSLTGPKTYKFKGYSITNPNDYAVSWKWTFGDGSPVMMGQQVTHTYANGGTYHVCLTIITHLGCEIKICKPIHVQGNAQPQLVLAPNPVANSLNATFVSTMQQTMTITIYNSNGLVVGNHVRNAIIGSNNWNFDVSALPPGMYSVVVHSANQIANALFIKQ